MTEIDPSRHLQLRAEMRLPGEALLDFRIEPVDAGKAPTGRHTGTGWAEAAATECRLVQEARFLPRGLLGLVYWYLVLPFHSVVFNGLLSGIVRRAETSTGTPAASRRWQCSPLHPPSPYPHLSKSTPNPIPHSHCPPTLPLHPLSIPPVAPGLLSWNPPPLPPLSSSPLIFDRPPIRTSPMLRPCDRPM